MRPPSSFPDVSIMLPSHAPSYDRSSKTMEKGIPFGMIKRVSEERAHEPHVKRT